jgi:hypothetical protein
MQNKMKKSKRQTDKTDSIAKLKVPNQEIMHESMLGTF